MDELIIANSNLTNAKEKYTKVYNSVVEMQAEMRKQSQDFYYRLALLSGGILSLNITFIGYLSSKSSILHYAELLYLSWFLLITALIGSLYRNHHNLNMGHWQTITTLNKARLEEYEAMLEMMKVAPEQMVSADPHETKAERMATTTKAITEIKKAIKNTERKNNKENALWLTAQYSAHIGFILGLIVAALFAAINLPVDLHFPVYEWIKWKMGY